MSSSSSGSSTILANRHVSAVLSGGALMLAHGPATATVALLTSLGAPCLNFALARVSVLNKTHDLLDVQQDLLVRRSCQSHAFCVRTCACPRLW